MEPYRALAEEFDITVRIRIGSLRAKFVPGTVNYALG
jgi:hypothetical protein